VANKIEKGRKDYFEGLQEEETSKLAKGENHHGDITLKLDEGF